jgi:CarD family transcriptional regulator
MGALVVHPAHGVVRVDGVRSQWIGGALLEVLVLRVIEEEARIFVPLDKAEAIGLRDVIGATDALRIWEILRQRTRRATRSAAPWSRRYRDYQDKLKRGSIFHTAEVFADLLQLQREKELSFGEQRMLDNARSRIVHELAAAQSISVEEIEAEVRALLPKPSLNGSEPPVDETR